MKKLKVSLFVLLCLGSGFVWLDRSFHRRPHELSALVRAFQPYSPKRDLPPLTIEEQQEVDQILSQKFTYYGKGSQAYVFISEDKQHVLKFLKQHILRPNSWLCHLPLPFNPYYNKYANRQKKLEAAYQACKIAFTDCKAETGLVYLHLNPSLDGRRRVSVLNKRGHLKKLRIDKTCFMIQKKADLIFPRITELMSQKDAEKAKGVITSLLTLIDLLGRKGVFDNDPKLHKNFALIDDQAVQIDVGNMKIDPARAQTYAYKAEFERVVAPFKAWIGENHPELLSHFMAQVAFFMNTSER